MLHQKETKRIRAYPTHQAVQTTGSTARSLAKRLPGHVFGVCNLRSIYTDQADSCFCAIRNYPDGISIDDPSDLVMTGE